MRLASLRRHWDEFGRTDPLWAILTAPDKRGNRWAVDEFLQTGREEIAALMTYLDARGLSVGRHRALDFGCGAGRLTHALARHFEEVIGLDIAPSMVEVATRLHAGQRGVQFRVNASDALDGIPSNSMDLVYSRLVLQHMRPRYIRRYLAEFVRVLQPGGVLIFQLPAAAITPPAPRGFKKLLPMPLVRVARAVRRLADFPRMEIYGIPRGDVERLLADLGAPVVDAVEDRALDAETPGYRYCAIKATRAHHRT